MIPGKKYTAWDFLQIVLRRKWLLIVPLVVGAYAGLVVSSQLQELYQSEMLIQVVPQRVPDTFVRSTVTMRTEDRLNALYQQVTSRTELERLITGMHLYEEERKRMPMQDVIERMRREILLDVVKSQQNGRDTEAFYIRFTYPDADVATKVVTRVGSLFIDLNARDRGSLADATSAFLETQLDEARQRLEELEKRLEAFRLRNSGRLPTQIEFNLQAMQNAQLQLQAQVESLARDRDQKLMLERLYSDAEALAAAEEPVPVPTPATAGDGATGTPQQQLVALQAALAAQELRLTPQHPDLIRLKRRISELEEQVAQAAKAGPDGARPVAIATTAERARRERLQERRAQIESLERTIKFKEEEEQRLRSQIAAFQSRIEQTPGVESEGVALMRDYQTQQEAYTELRRNSEQSKVAAELEKRQIGEQFRVLDPARRPLRPTGVARIQVNAIGAGLGLFLGLLCAAFLELRDTTFRRADDVRDSLNIPVLAVVSQLVDDSDRRRQKRRLVAAAAVSTIALMAGAYGFWALRLWKHLS